MGVDVLSLARNVLAEYLRTEFGAETPPREVEVLSEFPDFNKGLPELAVSISADEQGTPFTRYWEPAEFELTPNPADTAHPPLTLQTSYSYGRFKFPLQLDVWCKFPDKRNELVTRLNELLFRHPNETLHNDTWPRLGYWPELALPVPAATGVPANVFYFRFAEVPVPIESGDAAQEGDWSATVGGAAEGLFVSQEVVARLNTLGVVMSVADPTQPAPDPETFTLEF